MHPAVPLKRDTFKYLFVFDITQSMNVKDTGGRGKGSSRLDFAKAAVGETLRELPCSSQAGLAVFTEHRTFLLFAPVEICQHLSELSTMLQAIDWRMAWAASSEIAKGLYSSLLAAKALGPDTRIVFLSDGHEAPPIHPDFRPKFRGQPGEIQGAIIGIGGMMPVPIPRFNRDGKTLGYWKAEEVLQVDTFSFGRGATLNNEPMAGIAHSDITSRIKTGTEHLSSLRELYLKQLADETRLAYHRLESPEGLTELLKAPRFAEQEVGDADVRWVFALISLLIILSAYLIAPLSRLFQESVPCGSND
jgi:hypothetical protein